MVIVTIDKGKLKGRETKSDNGVPYYEFLGVPYAKPPIGNLRFRNPQPPESWDGVKDATVFNENNICCQVDMLKQNHVGSEDCLYLNVYTPKLPDPNLELLPVMVYIHGGGFIYCNGIDKQDLGPDYLIDNGVIVITINYRLGVLGFLSLDIPEASGNMGLKDQVQALKWVQSNIVKFGGDPNNVTIFGLSAGGSSVDYHLLSPLSKGLFHKAILHSGSCLNHWAINYEPKKIIEKLLDEMEYTGTIKDNQAIYDFLMTSDVSLLINASYKTVENFTSDRLFFGFVPTIEKDFGNNEAMITDYPYKLFQEGRFNHVPTIKGFCNKEGYLTQVIKPIAVLNLLEKKCFVDHFAFQMELNDKSKYNASFLEAYSKNIAPDDDNDKMAIEFFSHLDFVSGVYLSTNIMANKGFPIYLYEFCYSGNMNFFKRYFESVRKGAAHGDDFSYVFKHLTVSQFGEEKDFEIRENICKMWTNFAKTNNPTPDDETSLIWPEYKENSGMYLSIDEIFTVKTKYEPQKMDIFKQIYEKYRK